MLIRNINIVRVAKNLQLEREKEQGGMRKDRTWEGSEREGGRRKRGRRKRRNRGKRRGKKDLERKPKWGWKETTGSTRKRARRIGAAGKGATG
eukprot:gene7898-13783_t